MRLGTARRCITPRVGVELSGFMARVQPSLGVHDDLYARALYLQEDDEVFLWIHADLIAFEQRWVGVLRRRICRQLGLAAEQVTISATHTHSGPATVFLRGCGAVDEKYMDGLADDLYAVAKEAWADLRESRLWFAEGRCALARDRRAASALSHVDHRLPVLAFVDSEGRYRAVIANYAMHNVAMSAENRLISGDMAGAAARYVRAGLPGAPLVLMTNGACGNVDPPSLSAEPAVMQQFGGELGQRVIDACRQARPCASRLRSRMMTLELPLAIQTEEEIEEGYVRLRARFSDQPKWRRALRDWRAAALEALAEGLEEMVPSTLQMVRVGPVSLVAMGAEVFSRMGDELRRVSGPRTYVVGYANGDLGYLPYREIYAEGGYEVDQAYRLYRQFMIAPGGYERLRDGAFDML